MCCVCLPVSLSLFVLCVVCFESLIMYIVVSLRIINRKFYSVNDFQPNRYCASYVVSFGSFVHSAKIFSMQRMLECVIPLIWVCCYCNECMCSTIFKAKDYDAGCTWSSLGQCFFNALLDQASVLLLWYESVCCYCRSVIRGQRFSTPLSTVLAEYSLVTGAVPVLVLLFSCGQRLSHANSHTSHRFHLLISCCRYHLASTVDSHWWSTWNPMISRNSSHSRNKGTNSTASSSIVPIHSRSTTR